MIIRGIQKTSLVDYPGKLSSVIFLQGCNLRCKFCHNPDLLEYDNKAGVYSPEYAISLLKKRSSLIDGVVITGGEPAISKDIEDFISLIKSIPLKIKIDTNGLFPGVIERLIQKKLIDYCAVDVKTSPGKYYSLTNSDIDFKKIKKTIDVLENSGIDYEIRTTCVPGFVSSEDIKIIRQEIGHVAKYYIQQFINKKTLDPEMACVEPYNIQVLYEFREIIKTFADICEIRGI